MLINRNVLFALAILFTQQTFAQDAFKAMPHLFTPPKNYVATFATKEPKIDGDLNDAVWQKAAWTDEFVDIEGDLKPKPHMSTKLKMLWNDSCLFVAVQMQEPHLWANLTKHDDVIYNDNDFEIFVAPNNDTRNYFEIEVNQRNKIFDLFLPKPYRDGGDALIAWDAAGMKSAVKLQGTLNKSGDTDKGWTVEFKIPFKAITMGFGRGIPTEGSQWRINFSRVEWDTDIKDGKYVKQTDSNGKNLPERNWVWSPQGIISMHMPERWGYLQFTRKASAEGITVKTPYADLQKQYLWLVYYSQQQYFREHHSYANNLADLGISLSSYEIEGVKNTLYVEGGKYYFSANITDGKGKVWVINNVGMLQGR
ncbi:carbohydrate-binding family 9-like protein [Mucilaginibacter pedocola]|uniref:Carbohydrate-binding domain-containing protein n=1 Tax=Mucilaginibacter pedocola TaxID=1792845 RepID=A0A1S9P9V7_9SPHI|nr:carbohydrate-binding family 9-like protein [Mucilaginibacter pedocola]OOQ57617.1 hypothetical protein BC343_12485 [Mucilaginibacter pedocola]